MDINFSRRFKNYTNENIIGTISTSEGDNAFCIDGDATNFDKGFGLLIEGTINYYGTGVYLVNYEETNSSIDLYEFDTIGITGNNDWRISTYIKKGSYIYQFFYDKSDNKYKYYQYEITSITNSKGITKLEQVSGTPTELGTTGTTFGSISLNLYLIYHSGYFIFGFHGYDTGTTTNYMKLTSCTMSWDGSGNITYTYKDFEEFSIVSSSGVLAGGLRNYENYFGYYAARTTAGNQTNGRFAKLDASGLFTSVSSTISGLFRIPIKNRVYITKLTQKGKHMRISLGLLKYYNDSYSLINTVVSVPNADYYLLSCNQSTYTIFRGFVMNNGTLSSQGYFADSDNDISGGYYDLEILFPTNLLGLFEIGNENYIYHDLSDSELNLFTMSETRGGVEYFSTGNGISDPITVPSGVGFLFYNIINTLNGGVETVEIRWDSGSWIDVSSSKNSKINIPNGSTTLEFRITFDSDTNQTNTPIDANLIYGFYK